MSVKKYLSISITRGYTYDISGKSDDEINTLTNDIKDNDCEYIEQDANPVHYEGYVDLFEEN